MKVCALTMVYRDHWALGQWYAHYARAVGAQNLIVVAHGPDPEIARICPAARVITVPRDDLSGFDRRRGRMLNTLQGKLLNVFDWVIRTDVDELVCVDPGEHPSLVGMLAAQDAPAVFAVGLNVVELDGEPALPDGAQALALRRNAVFSGHYSKAWAVSQQVALMRHGVRMKRTKVAGFPFVLPRGVYLAHLKYANRAETRASNRHRMAVAAGSEKGLPGKAWAEADAEHDRYLQKTAALPLRDWDDGAARAYRKLGDPLRAVADGLVRARTVRFKFRVQLPDWFGAV